MSDIPTAPEAAEARHQRLTALDRAHVWHPFTQMQTWLEPLPGDEPVIIDHARGAWLFDTRGRKYLDAISSLWVNVHGHHRTEIDSAIRLQLESVAHTTLLGLASPPSIELAAELVRHAPKAGLAPGDAGLTKVFYSDSGSTAVEVALKMAFQHWKQRGQPQKKKFVALAEGYHGDTIGSVSVGGIDLFHQIFHPLLFRTIRVPPDALAVQRALAEHGPELAAFIVEPLVQGAAGIKLQPPGFLRTVAQACRRHDVLLIADEVAPGFGRTGPMFACEQEDVAPDLLCVAKGLSGGYLPVAATLASQAVFAPFSGLPG